MFFKFYVVPVVFLARTTDTRLEHNAFIFCPFRILVCSFSCEGQILVSLATKATSKCNSTLNMLLLTEDSVGVCRYICHWGFLPWCVCALQLFPDTFASVCLKRQGISHQVKATVTNTYSLMILVILCSATSLS
jgi:hypothetical protein